MNKALTLGAPGDGRAAAELAVDWAACRGHGLCAELLPEHVALDEWGYPVLSGPLPPQAVRRARSAVTDCPALALKLRRVRPEPR